MPYLNEISDNLLVKSYTRLIMICLPDDAELMAEIGVNSAVDKDLGKVAQKIKEYCKEVKSKEKKLFN